MHKRDFKPIVDYCKYAEFFQDAPFSKPYTFVVLDQEFCGSKFILTVRDSPEQWYISLTNSHAKKWGKNGHPPSKVDLQKAFYIHKGLSWEANRLSYSTPEDDPYNKEQLIQHYIDHKSVIGYFRHRPDDLLVLNIGEEGSYKIYADFLGLNQKGKNFLGKIRLKR